MKKVEAVVLVFLITFLLISVIPVSAGVLSDINEYLKKLFNAGESGELRGELATMSGVADDNLIGYWNFNGNLLSSVGDNDGVNYGTSSVDGVNEKARSFDGVNDYVEIAHSSGLDITGAGTWAAWIYLKSGGKYQSIITKTVNNGVYNNPYDFRTNNLAIPSLIFVRAPEDEGIGPFVHEWFESADTLSLNAWHFVAVTVDSLGNSVFYIDGNPSGGGTFTINPTGNTNPVLIGGRDDGLFFNGLIDEVKIWNYALTEEEIREEGGFTSLVINDIQPTGIIEVVNLPAEVELFLETSKVATCFYNFQNSNLSEIVFFNTYSTLHSQSFGSLGSGEYLINIKCEDKEGNERQASTSFEVRLVGESTCTDSDVTSEYPDGLNYYVNGRVISQGFEQFDRCVDDPNELEDLAEAYCDNGRFSLFGYECPNGCEDGACVEQSSSCGDGVCSNGVNMGDLLLGETTTVYYNEMSYEIGLIDLSEQTATIQVNGIIAEVSEGTSNVIDDLIVYVRDIDYYLPENIARVSLYIGENARTCSEDCLSEGECSELIEKVVSPEDFIDDGIEYTHSGSYFWEGMYWINGSEYSYNEYSASWHNYYDEENNYIYYNVMVFDDETLDLQGWLEQRTDYRVCALRDYWSYDNQQNKVYVCNWDILNDDQNLNNYQYKSRQVLWVNDNIAVEIQVSTGRELSDEEVILIGQKRLNDFLNDLGDNNWNYIEWEDFNVDWPLLRQIEKSLMGCSSDVPMDACEPSWRCRLEPVICPEYGYQTKTCVDSYCDSEKREERVYCSPGLCSGCYVPKWFESFDNICIPYGIRFEQQTSWGTELRTHEDQERLMDGMMDEGEVEFVVESEDLAVLTLYDRDGEAYVYDLIPGEEIEITIPDWDDDIESFMLYTESIYYSVMPGESYADVTIHAEEWVNVEESFNAYCDYDGEVKQQKTKDYNGNWANCQNNYECESNLCSSGECVEVTDMIQNAKGFKSTFVRVFCKFAHLFSIENYEECVYNRLDI